MSKDDDDDIRRNDGGGGVVVLNRVVVCCTWVATFKMEAVFLCIVGTQLPHLTIS